MKFKNLLATFALLLSASALADFDPTHQDIDIFMTNPSITAERPNVVIVLDTSANWQSYFASEKSALISVINGLTDGYNVGLMLNTGGSIEGSYVRYAVRQMTSTNKSAFSSLINDLTNAPATNFAGDKTNNPVPGQSMVEAYRYFKGLASYSAGTHSEHDPRTDYNGNINNSWITSLPGNAFPAAPAVADNYSSPVSDGCQKNFIIYISNGKGSNQIGEKTTAKNELTSAKGSTATPITPLTPTGNETDSWFDEWADYLANTGFSMSINGATKTVTASTYVVEINPGAQSADLQWSATLKSGSRTHGNGQYYSTNNADPGSQLAEALSKIFNEIQAVNSVFASTTLPVSVNVRGTNLNQVYIGMFRPDANKAPRWYGNLKLYKLALIDNALELVDANANTAESQTTGFIIDTAKSFWTHDSTFWSFRDSTQNGKGGQSDSPDGDLVEKGAVAQQIRETYASSQTARNLYTCNGSCSACTIGGSGTAQTCTGGSNLSVTPFSTANANITAAVLGLGTKDVSPLTAKVTKSVTAIVDRRSVSLNNATGSVVSVTGISNGAVSHAVSAVTPFDSTKQMNTTALTGLATSMSATAIQSQSSSGSSVTLAISTSGFASNPCTGKDYVTVIGNDASVNGTWPITGSATTTSPARHTVTFTVSGSPSPSNQGSLYCSAKSTTATATVNTLPNGLAVNSRINISGAAPDAFNGNFLVTAVNATNKTFSYTLGSVQGAATTQGSLKVYNTVNAGVYSATSSTVRITVTSASNGYSATNTVALADITPTVYNGTATVATAATNSFTYDFVNATASASWPFADATAFGTTYKGAATTATVTVASNTLFGTSPIDISGTGSSCFDKTGAVVNWTSGTQFTYTTSAACAPIAGIPAGAQINVSGYSTTVTATLANHGYVTGNTITIADGSTAWHNGSFTITGYTANTFTYTNGNVGAPVAPSGQYTVRLTSNPLAYVTAPAHGFGSGDSVTISGANPAGYNLTTTASGTPAASANLMVVDADTFTYPLASAQGTNTGTVTASKQTTTAYAHSVAHGFADGSSVAISGATPSAFNGTFTIKSTGNDDFIYCLNDPTHNFTASPACSSSGTTAGDASGTIVAAAGSGSNSEATLLINWVRGQDNAIDPGGENNNGSKTDCRASVHGDVLHSRPAVINYNRYGGDNDVYVFYGSNDGVFRSVKGGATNDASDPTTLSPGQEAWGFVPTEGFTSLKRLRNNSPLISSSFKKQYFMDGPIGVYTLDGDSDGRISSSSANDKAYLYVGARRGGRFIYSLNVTNPVDPTYRWKIDNSTSGFSELGYTFSLPTVVTGINGYTNPVLIFGGGYDPDVEDIENCSITATTAASGSGGSYTPGTVTYTNGTISYNTSTVGCTITGGSSVTKSRSMGRAIYIVDAITGAKIWSASYPGSGADLEVTGMDYAIPSDVTVIKNLSGGTTNRAYVGDAGGNLWRIDFGDADKHNWKVTKIASISDLTTHTSIDGGSYVRGYRKFQNPPDVVAQASGADHFDAVVLGTGDREHPFDNTVINRFYMFKDRGTDAGPGTGTTYFLKDTNGDGIGDTPATQTRVAAADGSGNPVITHSGTTDGQLDDVTTAATTTASADGWFFTLGTGEKVIGNAVALNGIVFFNTNQPSATTTDCDANLGIARQYQVTVASGVSPRYQQGGTVTLASRSTVHAGGGFLPSPVHVVVQVENEKGEMVTKEGVISGTSVETPTTGAVGSRTRRFWYKEIDE